MRYKKLIEETVRLGYKRTIYDVGMLEVIRCSVCNWSPFTTADKPYTFKKYIRDFYGTRDWWTNEFSLKIIKSHTKKSHPFEWSIYTHKSRKIK